MAIKTLQKTWEGGNASYFPVHGLQPGDILELEGNYYYIYLRDVIGTAENPIRIRVKGGTNAIKVGINNHIGWIMQNSKHFIIEGAVANDPYGIKVGGNPGQFISQSFSFHGSEKFTVSGMELANAQVGFFCNPLSGTYSDIIIKDSKVHTLGNPSEGGRAEGVYIGNTSASTIGSGSFNNVQILNCVFDNLSGDGIQVALTKNLLIKGNKITNFGKSNLVQQRTGIIVGGCSSGIVQDNVLENGTGSPFQCFGGGDTYFINNTAKNCATSDKEDGFYLRGNCANEALRVHLIGNTIDKVNRQFVRQDTPNVVVEDVNNKFGVQPVTYQNTIKSKVFKKVCVNGVGSDVTYTVPAGKYQSIVSQLDADNKALADIEANGQTFANLNGTCPEKVILFTLAIAGKTYIIYTDGTWIS